MAKKGMAPVKQYPVIFAGGLDIVTPPQLVEEGRLAAMQNYECDLNGGYRQVAGFERYDGQQSPSDASFFAFETDLSVGFFQSGEVITGGTSGATAITIGSSDLGIYLVDITGVFQIGESIAGTTSTSTANLTSTAQADLILADGLVYNDMRYEKEIYFRDLIAAVPGTGPVRGVFQHEGVTLAIRDFDATNARMYKASAAGWVRVLGTYIMFYDTRGLPVPLPGTVLDDGVGNTATLLRNGPVTTAGTNGYMVLTDFTGGFAAAANIEAGASVIATVATGGAPVEFELLKGGTNEWRSNSFSGSPNFYRVYTADGVNPCVEYDPILDLFMPIYTDQAYISIDTPAYVGVYHNQLFLGYTRGILRNCEPSDPYTWDAASGSLEIAVGSAVTGLDEAPKTLIVTTSRTTFALTGSTSTDFILDVASKNTGALAHTVQHIGTTYMVDDRGIIELRRVQEFGNFDGGTVSRTVQPLIQRLKTKISASTINLTNNLYKVFTSDGEGVSVTFQEGKIVGFGSFNLGIGVNVASNAEDATGTERTLIGSSDGFVYETGKGVSFDGAVKDTWLQTVFHHFKSSAVRKRYLRLFIDAVVVGNSNISITAAYSNGSQDAREMILTPETVTGSRSTWDSGSWNIASFDTSSVVNSAYIDLTGTGDSISLIVYNSSAKNDILTLKDIMYVYKIRRGLRSSR